MDNNTAVLDHGTDAALTDICIPPCPTILTKLMQETREDEPDFRKVSKLIGGDASLAAAMLQTVNSPFYGLRSKATSVQQAIALLGLRNVTQLATGVMLRNTFSGGSNELMDEYWESSSAIAQISAQLASRLRGIDRDEAYTFALFRDCGMLAMMDGYDNYVPVFPGVATSGSEDVIALENERHGIDHARVGYNLAKMWLLPEEICQAVLWHHDYAALLEGQDGIPAGAVRKIALALVAEWIFVKQDAGADSPEWLKGSEFAKAMLKLSDDDLEAALAEIKPDLANGKE
jgi:HD-like signal output (HDOD) protein